MSIADRNNRTIALQSSFMGVHHPFTCREVVAAVAVLLLAMYLLTPRFWEPCGETWKHWAAARILRETGGFPVFTLGPVYIAYLQLFLFLNYPQSVQLEYIVTHLFCYVAIFLMLRSFVSMAPAVFLASAWIPVLGIVESSATVAGIGFLALYFKKKSTPLSHPYFPPSLAAAALCHSGYAAFFAGHILGVLRGRVRAQQPILGVFPETWQGPKLPRFLNAGMALLVLVTIFFPSHRSDHNHALMDGTYSPIPLKEPVTISFIQNGNWKFAKNTTPQSSWIYQDWYFTNDKAFGGATTILQAVLNRPDTSIFHILDNLRFVANIPVTFLGGPRFLLLGSWMVGSFSWAVLLISLVGIAKSYEESGALPYLCAIAAGTAGVVASLSLTVVLVRYVMTLLPVGLLMVVHIWPSLSGLIKSVIEKSVGRHVLSATMVRSRERVRIACGAALLFVGIMCNEWLLAGLFSSDGRLIMSTRMTIWLLEGILIAAGIAILHRRQALEAMLVPKDGRFINAVVGLSAVCVLLTVAFPHGARAQAQAVLANQAWLSGAEPVSMVAAHQPLLAALSKETTVLASEDLWIKAFAEVDFDKVKNVFSLPPFPDRSGDTERTLEGIDVIGVSEDWSREEPTTGMQSFLRYRLHVEPFLKAALGRGWSVEVIDGYGKLYRRPTRDNGG